MDTPKGGSRPIGDGSGGEEDSKPSRHRSVIWKFFTKNQTLDGPKAVCIYCNSAYVSTGRSGTNHLRRHITVTCPCAPQEAKELLKCSSSIVGLANSQISENKAVKADAIGEEDSRQSRKQSVVWNFFTKNQSPDGLKAICNYCNSAFVASARSGTTHLRRHIAVTCTCAPQEAKELLKGSAKHNEKILLELMDAQICENEIIECDPIGEEDSRPSRHWSIIWNFFTKIQTPDGLRAVCNYCNGVFVATGRSGTTHLRRHIAVTCTRVPLEAKVLLKGSSKHNEKFMFDQEVSRRALARFIITSELSFGIVEHPDFIEFIHSLRPDFNLFSPVTAMKDCLRLYEEEKHKLKNFLSQLSSRVSFTTGIWTSNQKMSYVSLKAHYIDDDFILCKKVISFRKMLYPQTSFALSDAIEECLLNWNLDSKICALTVENCATSDAAARILREQFVEKLLFRGKFLHVRCCSHVLNTMVQDGMHAIHNAVESLRDLICYVMASPSRLLTFNELAQQLNLPVKRAFSLDVPTRWNSTYNMLCSALEYKDVFTRYAIEHHMIPPNLEDWGRVEEMKKFLSSFLDAANVFSCKKYPTSNLYLKEIWGIRDLLIAGLDHADETIKTISTEMHKKFSKYWDEFNMIFAIASVLDPRMKMMFVQFCFDNAYGIEESVKKVSQVHEILSQLYEQYLTCSLGQVSTPSSCFGVGIDDQSSRSTSHLGKRKLITDFVQFKAQNFMKRPKKLELESYLEEEPISDLNDSTFDVLEWWRSNKSLYPTLSRVARDVLAIPVSTLSSESAFNIGGLVIDEYGSSLTPETVEGLFCAQDWLRLPNEGECSSVSEALEEFAVEL